MITTERSRIKRLPKRAAYDTATTHAIFDAAFLAHVGFVLDGQPFVIPTLYGRKDDTLYFHGSPASRMLRESSTGIPMCVSVTLVESLVLARSAFHHSMNYRSVVAFGKAHLIQGVEPKKRALRVISEQVLVGRWDEVRQPSLKELKATAVLEFAIEEASAKIRTGPPIDDPEDYALQVWAGIVPLLLAPQPPIPDPKLQSGIHLPDSVQRLVTPS